MTEPARGGFGDSGASWSVAAVHLPPVLSVSASAPRIAI